MLNLDDFGLVVDPAQPINRDEADAAFLDAVRAKNRSAWIVGDLLNTGCVSEQALDGCILSQKTMANYQSVCSRFPKHLRLIPLSQSHYEAATALAATRMDEALQVLRAAYDGGMTRDWVRDECARRMDTYVESAELELIYRAEDGVFAISGVIPDWLRDGTTKTITVRQP